MSKHSRKRNFELDRGFGVSMSGTEVHDSGFFRRSALIGAAAAASIFMFLAAAGSAHAAVHGSIIKAQAASKATKVKNSSSTKLIFYWSKNAAGDPVKVSGLLAMPKGKPPKGGWPLITWAHGTTGIADKCAPSNASAENTGAANYISYAAASYSRWVKAGYAVVMTDYAGLDNFKLGNQGPHEYLVGTAAGQSVLDAVAAARTKKASGGRIGKNYVIAGHSQGGHAAIWAAHLATEGYLSKSKYNLRGTIAYAPASGIDEYLEIISGLQVKALTPLASLIAYGAGLQMESDITDVINPRLLDDTDSGLAINGASFWDAIDNDLPGETGACTSELGVKATQSGGSGIAPSALLGDNDAFVSGAFTNPIVEELYQQIIADEPTTFSNLKNLLILQGGADQTVFPIYTEKLVGENKGKLGDPSRNNDITYWGPEKYGTSDHGGIVSDDKPSRDVANWLKTVF